MSDFLVVGGGSCGSVVAARLADLPGATVTLLEVGPGWDDDMPDELLDTAVLPIGVDSPWAREYAVSLRPGHTAVVMRGRTLGGSGAVNGSYFMRAARADFEEWPPEWSFHEVLDDYRRSEHDHDFAGPYHGDAGPIPIRRAPASAWTATSTEFADACTAAGFAYHADKNAPDTAGVGPVPSNVDERGNRVNAALAYLSPRRPHPGLRIHTDAEALTLAFAGTRVVGVHTRTGTVLADRVVLCAGAIESAALLLRSGIGDPVALRGLGIPVVAAAPGVGTFCSDHPEVGVRFDAPAHAGPATALQVVLNHDGVEFRPYTRSFGDLVPGSGVEHRTLGLTLMAPHSRGRLSLRSADPAVAPVIDYHHLSNPADRAALHAAADIARDLLARMPSCLPERWNPARGEDDDAWLHARLGTSQHLAGTAPMGADDDPFAVVDEHGTVRGVTGLTVADPSIAPAPISRGMHATAVMIAEHVVARLRPS
ncbi:MAG TPA: mycofactocin system GMC family oxidoreductase MftG [Aldersonia sp.]